MNMNMNTSSPGVREPLYPHQEDRRRTEDEEEMDIIITKIQEDQTYRSSSRLVRIIQVDIIFTCFSIVYHFVTSRTFEECCPA